MSGPAVAHGGQEHAGSAYPAEAIALLRGMEQACTHLLAFPEYFADQLEQQDARLTAHFPLETPRARLQGDQYVRQVRSTPGESLQGFASRVGVAWETLALVNRLTYPYLLEQPTTVARGRASHADLWTLTDGVQHWSVDAYQGYRVDMVGGAGAGQPDDCAQYKGPSHARPCLARGPTIPQIMRYAARTIYCADQ
jgi:hypothetical protein